MRTNSFDVRKLGSQRHRCDLDGKPSVPDGVMRPDSPGRYSRCSRQDRRHNVGLPAPAAGRQGSAAATSTLSGQVGA